MTERTIFLQALDIADPGERARYVESACAGDTALRRQVEELLAAHQREGTFLDVPAVDQVVERLAAGHGRNLTEAESAAGDLPLHFLAPSQKPDSLGRLGHYEVLEVVGKGGMGTVLRAFDEKLHRVVALKAMAAELAATSPPRKRFLREARSAAQVRHEHVVDIHAVEEQPIPYLVMEYVPGETLQQKHERVGPFETREILRVGQQIARGLTAAHEKGLIHRDIKPSNILLEKGAEERVKITDFGLARAVADASLTQSGVIAGTPMYMAPEQTVGDSVDHRADLFSLGSVLYTMASGRPPFRATTSMATLKRVAEDNPRPIREIIPEVPEWLCAIIAKLHAKNPDDRFQSAKEVAELLKQHLLHLENPVLAPMPASLAPLSPLARGVGGEGRSLTATKTPFENAGRATRRRRWAVAAAVLLCVIGSLSLTEATGVTNVRATVLRIFTAEGTLIVEVDDPEVKVTIEGDGGLVISGAGPREVRLRPGTYRFQATKDGKPIRNEIISITQGDKQVVKVSGEGLREPPVAAEVRRFEGHRGFVQGIALTPGGGHALSVAWEDTIRLWDTKTGQEVHGFRVHEEGNAYALQCVAVSADGRRALAGGVAKALGKPDGVGKVWLLDLENHRVLHHCDHPYKPEDYFGVNAVAFSPDGGQALLGSFDGVVRIWDVETWKELSRFEHTWGLWSVDYSPDGRQALIASGGPNFRLSLYTLDTRKEVKRFEGHKEGIWRAVFSPDGRLVASASDDKTVRVWDAGTGKELRSMTHPGEVHDVAFCPDGRRIVTACHDRMVRLWDSETGRELHRFAGHTDQVLRVVVSTDGRVMSTGADRTCRLWELPQ